MPTDRLVLGFLRFDYNFSLSHIFIQKTDYKYL